MDESISVILNQIYKSGYKVFVVGGYVRNMIWGINNDDIDIVTDAPSFKIKELFKGYGPKEFKNQTVSFKYNKYNIDVAQIRGEQFINGKIKVTFTSDLYEDYMRRDFTMNAIYMDKDGNYYEFDNSVSDCKNFKLKFIGDPTIKCKEDPTRILRAIYFILKYDMKDYNDLYKVDFDSIDFSLADINLLNKIIFKILKLNKNESFIFLLDKCNIYDSLFIKRSTINNLKPIDFLINNGYIYIDSIIN